MAQGSIYARIISQYSAKGSKEAARDLKRLQSNIDNFSRKATQAFAVATAASAAFAIKLGKDAVKAAQDDIKEQILLTNTLRNTVGATDAQIAAVNEYIDKTELLTNIQGDQLIPSFNKLVVATGSSTDAMLLQSVAIDAAAGSGMELEAVTGAIVKATQGNFTALKKMFPALDASIVKNKDLGAALLYVDKTYGGAAAALAEKDPFGRLSVSVEKLKEKLGYALIPALTDFVNYLISDVIPELEYWLELNQNGIKRSLDSAVSNIKEFAKALSTIFDVLRAINQVLPLGVAGYIQLGAALYGAGKAIAFAGGALKAYTIFAKANKTATDQLAPAATGLASIIRKSNDVTQQGNRIQRMFNKALVGVIGSFKSLLIVGPKMAVEQYKVNAALMGTGTAATFANTALLRLKATFLGALAFAKKYFKQILILIAAFKTLDWIMKKVSGNETKTLSDSAQKLSNMFEAHDKMNQSMDDAVNKYKAERSAIESVSKEEKQRLADLAKMKAIQLAAEQRQAAAEAKRTAVLARLKKMQQVPGKGKAKVGGIVPTSTLESAEQEAINFRAAELLLIKQKDNSEELKRLKALKDRIDYQKLVNEQTQRYVDILRVLGDQKITDDEIKALAQGWKMPVEAVKAYLIQFQAVSDGKISNEEITNLAKTWGSTEAQAKQYLEFYNAINDGYLSTEEIDKLKKNWGMTEAQVRQYADFVQVVNDGKLDDSEVVKLQEKWKLSIDEVVAYIKKIGSPVAYSGTLIDPAKAAEIGWLNATAALQRYLDLLAKGSGSPSTGTPPTTVIPPVTVIPPKNDGLGGSKTDSAASSASAAASAASAIAYAVAKATGDTVGASLAAAGVTPSALASKESGAIGAASIAAQLKAAEDAVRISSSLAAFKAKEAADLAASQAAAAQMDYDERFRFRAAQGVMAGAGTPVNSGGSVNVTVNVAGSVTAEQDLVTSIRNGLLSAQYNGNSITLEAI
jgi:hypothetical protein